ncbi:hypothetical protein T03_11708 [Trichinella britovi]|uniref:Uncharacterized protein n=1 Tax=Trichinella britovi TaxID=45882 RepID=A0A0V1D2Y7_TRIBR|nr:hypothetical protein T03_11708 [Trichinella britovi]
MLMLRELKLTKPAEYQIRMNKKQNYIWARYKCSCEKQASKMLFRVGSSRCIALVVVVARRKVYSTLRLCSQFEASTWDIYWVLKSEPQSSLW